MYKIISAMTLLNILLAEGESKTLDEREFNDFRLFLKSGEENSVVRITKYIREFSKELKGTYQVPYEKRPGTKICSLLDSMDIAVVTYEVMELREALQIARFIEGHKNAFIENRDFYAFVKE